MNLYVFSLSEEWRIQWRGALFGVQSISLLVVANIETNGYALLVSSWGNEG